VPLCRDPSGLVHPSLQSAGWKSHVGSWWDEPHGRLAINETANRSCKRGLCRSSVRKMLDPCLGCVIACQYYACSMSRMALNETSNRSYKRGVCRDPVREKQKSWWLRYGTAHGRKDAALQATPNMSPNKATQQFSYRYQMKCS
jgi:hypothetical protein